MKVLLLLILSDFIFTSYGQLTKNFQLKCEFENDLELNSPYVNFDIYSCTVFYELHRQIFYEGPVDGDRIGNLTNLDVTHFKFWSGIAVIPQNISPLLPNIKWLEILELSKLSHEDLKQFKYLQVLYIYGGFIENLKSDCFSSNKDLVEIMIINARIKSIQQNTFDNLHKIKRIDLSNNECASIEWHQGLNRSLENFFSQVYAYCALSNVPVCRFDKKSEDSYYTCTIKMPHKEWTDETAAIEYHNEGMSNKDVLELDIQSSELDKIPLLAGKKFPNLKVFRNSNKIQIISRWLMIEYENLEELYLQNNRIRSVASDTFNFNPNLTLVNLEGNPLVSIGIGVFWVPKLLKKVFVGRSNCFGLEGNNRNDVKNFVKILKNTRCGSFDSFDCTFKMMNLMYVGRVYTCYDENNNEKNTKTSYETNTEFFHAIGEHVDEKSNEDVEALIIKNEKISEFKTKIYLKLPILKYVEVVYSQVKKIDKNAFIRLINLNVVDFSFNQLQSLPKEIFLENKKLISVNFEGNFLEIIPDEIFSGMNDLMFVNFYDNECIDKESIDSVELVEFIKVIKEYCTKMS